MLGDPAAVDFPTWAVVARLALPALDFLHSLTPWSRRLWTQFDHEPWSRYWSVVAGIRWVQVAVRLTPRPGTQGVSSGSAEFGT